MCADTKAEPKSPASEPNNKAAAEKVRTSRYEWERETVANERRQKPRQLLRSSALLAAVGRFFRTLFGSGTNPFDKDNDADPMAA